MVKNTVHSCKDGGSQYFGKPHDASPMYGHAEVVHTALFTIMLAHVKHIQHIL